MARQPPVDACHACIMLLLCCLTAAALLPACTATGAGLDGEHGDTPQQRMHEPMSRTRTRRKPAQNIPIATPLSQRHALKQEEQSGAPGETHTTRKLQEASDDVRGLKMTFYDALDSSRSAKEVEYIMSKVMPTTASVLARSIRVRESSGMLPLAGKDDQEGEPIPGAADGIDADIMVKVMSQPEGAAECEGISAIFTGFRYTDSANGRPVFAQMNFCQVSSFDLESDVGIATHELLHALGMDPSLFNKFLGYPNGKDDILTTTAAGAAFVTTPNVVKAVQDHFGCDSVVGAEVEDDGGTGTAGGHWEERIFAGELMDAAQGLKFKHYERHALTDVSLGLLQDTGWYDVKYGSGGFNSFGYQAGCAFASGALDEALDAPAAARYLCTQPEVESCTHDHSMIGICIAWEAWEEFDRTEPLSSSVDCQKGATRGLRCLQNLPEASEDAKCVAMKCSDDGEVLLTSSGAVCDPEEQICPDKEYMCGDPGMLTCVGALNDCSGQGDCFKGSCYCHLGWGGDDCSVPACIHQDGCSDGSSCPASGFCGVPECGTWSCGATDRGVPCIGAVGPTPESSCSSSPGASSPPTAESPVESIEDIEDTSKAPCSAPAVSAAGAGSNSNDGCGTVGVESSPSPPSPPVDGGASNSESALPEDTAGEVGTAASTARGGADGSDSIEVEEAIGSDSPEVVETETDVPSAAPQRAVLDASQMHVPLSCCILVILGLFIH